MLVLGAQSARRLIADTLSAIPPSPARLARAGLFLTRMPWREFAEWAACMQAACIQLALLVGKDPPPMVKACVQAGTVARRGPLPRPPSTPLPMIDKLRLFLLSVPCGKIFRHVLNASSGALAAHGVQTTDTPALVASVLALAFSGAWSAMAKTPAHDTRQGQFRFFAEIIAAQIVSAVSGALAAHGLNANDSAEFLQGSAALMFGGNYALSKLSRPDTEAKALALIKGELRHLLALILVCMLLPSCASFTRDVAANVGALAGLAAADVGLMMVQYELATARAALDAAKHEPGADVRAIIAKSLALELAARALSAAQHASAKEQARRAAKQPLPNVNPSASARRVPDVGARVALALASDYPPKNAAALR